MTATYWEVGRRIVEFEQRGKSRAAYGEELLKRLSTDLGGRFGKGFSRSNLQTMRLFFLALPPEQIRQTLSAKSGSAQIRSTATNALPETHPNESARKRQTLSGKSCPPGLSLNELARAFPLPWSHYVLLIAQARSPEAFSFYHAEALRGGWSVRQLQRQLDSQFYERTALSRDKAAMLRKGSKPKSQDAVSADEEIRDPLVLEFLNLRDEYSETDLEDALIRQLETFLLELGDDFAFIGRQRRLRIDDEWFRVDLLFFHRGLRCLVIFDLKLGRFTHADSGQMTVYLNYAREHWTHPGENPPVGVILCSSKGESLARYATESLSDKMLVREYLTVLPDERLIAAELERTRKTLEARKPHGKAKRV
jgi:predicted nuclease of restriction endonuclease-like (RecB) superfamily